MWLCTNQGFTSVVADRYRHDRLLLRARVAGHIEAMFPDAEVFTDTNADYLYRAFIGRKEAALLVSKAVQEIDYFDFKSSVTDEALHDVYLDFWQKMHELQRTQGKASLRHQGGL